MPYADKEKGKANRKAYYMAHKAEMSEYSKKYREENLDRLKESHRVWIKNNPLSIKNYALKRRYGITIQQFDDLLEAQNGLCAICKIHYSEFSRRFHVDHCHVSKKVRGVLCVNCNTALGHFKENADLLQEAIDSDISALCTNSKKGFSKFSSNIENVKLAKLYIMKFG